MVVEDNQEIAVEFRRLTSAVLAVEIENRRLASSVETLVAEIRRLISTVETVVRHEAPQAPPVPPRRLRDSSGTEPH